jgi:FKBP-type peptidyl-prolyl cis-trans isomerase 2
MAEKVGKGDFVELDYTGVLKDGNIVFDTTIADIAKKEGIFDPKMTYAPVSICVGQGQILQGLDSHLEGLEIGEEKELLLAPADAFGKKDAKLMKLVPTAAFKKQGINPMVGLQVNIDGMVGTVRTVSGGRTIVDFNHPFAGKEVVYKVKVNRLLTDDREKILALVELALNQRKDAINIDIKEGAATVTVKKEFPKELLEILRKRVTSLLPHIRSVEFQAEKREAVAAEKKEEKTAKA